MISEQARAKINLNLHLGKIEEDPDHDYFGLHPLTSLVMFADYGDELSCEEAARTQLVVQGPFADGLTADENNLILKAYAAVSRAAEVPALAFKLTKNLPIASGIGGGSADAASALRLMRKFVDLPETEWLKIAQNLGADVPVCFHSRTCVMSGIGEKIEFVLDKGRVAALLINPGIALSTKKIFQLFDQRTPSEDVSNLDKTYDIGGGRNDLQPIAIEIAPDIQSCLNAVSQYNGCRVARMSGSGATCFGLFEKFEHAFMAGEDISSKYSNWWVQPVMLGDTP